MDRLTEVLNNIDIEEVKKEIEGKHYKDSKTLNKKITEEFNQCQDIKHTRTILINLFNEFLDGSYSLEQWRKYINAFDRIIKVLYTNENTILPFTIQIKKLVKAKVKQEGILNLVEGMGLTAERVEQRKQEYRKIVNERNYKRNKQDPIYLEDIIDKIKYLAKSYMVYNNFVAILLATGLRAIEILKVSKFLNEDEAKDEDGYFSFKYLAKRLKSEEVFTRPIIGMDKPTLLKLVRKIRENINTDGTNRQIANRINVSLNNYFKKFFKFTAHKARSMYGNICYELYAEPENIPYETYIQDQLNHLNAESTKSYLSLNIKSKSKLIDNANEVVKNIYTDEIEKLKKEMEEMRKQMADKMDTIKNTLETNQQTITEEATQTESRIRKVNHVVKFLKDMKESGRMLNQKKVRETLGYSSLIVTDGYKLARTLNIIT